MTRETPLHLAIRGGDYEEVVRFMVIELGRSVGELSLELAVKYDRPRVFAFLQTAVPLTDFTTLHKAALLYGHTSYIDLLLAQEPSKQTDLSACYDVAVKASNLKSLCYLRRTGHVALEQIIAAYKEATQSEQRALLSCEAWVARAPGLFAMSVGEALGKFKPALRRLIIEFL
jgi:hypothetical protein